MKIDINSRLVYSIYIILIFCFINFFSLPGFSVEPEEFLENDKLELRARNISKNIRCLVCQNQSIDDSFSPLAKDLRKIIRKKILIGLEDDEIYNFLTDRYGDYILLKPSVKKNTFILWIFPFFVLIAALTIYIKKRQK